MASNMFVYFFAVQFQSRKCSLVCSEELGGVKVLLSQWWRGVVEWKTHVKSSVMGLYDKS